ncbi:G-D-S-L family lipolytic protein [Pseudodesulfovibrio cashew]|uniref:G-D-S-L family lipolytic protein n=1 Tax=Pseudodesulfovibrio cashew TaxID=2678688 RepID=A0A6I6JBM5_9BACT|nr:GDSL-type esterase/lipase family protein [Pseudodesulfovibrio cashew]QGY40176.1 G-D-S-L family lipolytic protein [Pseudodesulfovibrio cashew]
MIICYFGDSLTLGYGDPSGLGWPGRVSGKLASLGVDVTSYNLGVRQDATTRMAKRWKAEAEPRRMPSREYKLVFSFGVADQSNKVAPADSLAAAEAMLTEAMDMGEVLLVGPPPVSNPETTRRIGTLSEQFAGLCERLGLPYVPVIDAMLAHPVYGKALEDGDGAHPSALGYAVLAECILESEPARDFFGLE